MEERAIKAYKNGEKNEYYYLVEKLTKKDIENTEIARKLFEKDIDKLLQKFQQLFGRECANIDGDASLSAWLYLIEE